MGEWFLRVRIDGIRGFGSVVDMRLAVLSLFSAGACLAQPGALDLAFNPGSGPGGSASRIVAMCLIPNGQILVAGFFTTFNGFPSQYVARLNADGSFDPNIPCWDWAG
jgi:hypothetical protein